MEEKEILVKVRNISESSESYNFDSNGMTPKFKRNGFISRAQELKHRHALYVIGENEKVERSRKNNRNKIK